MNDFSYQDYTKFKLEVSLYKGNVDPKTYRNDQLHLFVKETDYEALANRMASWYSAEMELHKTYSVLRVRMDLGKTYSISAMLQIYDQKTNRLTIKDIGTFPDIAANEIEEYLSARGMNLTPRFDETCTNLYDAFVAGKRYRKYRVMLKELGYKAISTKASGLIIADDD